MFDGLDGRPQPGTRIEVRLRRMNTTTKPVTLATLAASLPPNPFKRLDIYQVDETRTFSTTIRLVVAAARAMGLKGVLQIFDDQDRRIVRKHLQHSKVEYFSANHVWDQVEHLLKPLSLLYTEDNE
jgi:gamma-glutamyl:cysteine ligase YbdK (ATP-grasp superfamily)